MTDKVNDLTTFLKTSQWLVGALAGLALILGISAVMAAPAQAQGAPPEICDEYPNLDVCDDDDGGDGNDNDDDFGPGGGGDDDLGSGTGDSDGSLPFTGYPLSGLILLLLALLALGFAIRGGVALRDRFGRSPTGP